MSGGGDADVARGRVREAQPHSAVMDTEGITQLGKMVMVLDGYERKW